jgi:hypothetical protein
MANWTESDDCGSDNIFDQAFREALFPPVKTAVSP